MKRRTITGAEFLFILGLLTICSPHAMGEEVFDPNNPKFTPGKIIRVETPKVGYHGYFRIYVPKNYTPDRAWPVIFSYHGLGGKPSISPFNALTNGEGFIIVGMAYADKRNGTSMEPEAWSKIEERYKTETSVLRDVYFPFLAKYLNVDKQALFIGGTSRGGWSASMIAENVPGCWRGVIILAAGRQRRERPMPHSKGFRDKPILIGVGEKDTNYDASKKAVAFYERHGAKVTLEVFPGLGHAVDGKNEVLMKWLLHYGLGPNIASDLASAKKFQDDGQLGKAYLILGRVGKVSKTYELCQKAAAAAKQMAGQANEQVAAAAKAAKEERYAEAVEILDTLVRAYKGTAWSEEAAAMLQKLKNDPQIAGLIEQQQIDAKAKEIEVRAKAYEEKKRYGRAIRLYEQCIEKYPNSTRVAEITKHLDELKKSLAARRETPEDDADSDCRKWMRMAKNYINVGKPDKARLYLKKIIETYPTSRWAKEARECLAELRG